MHRQAPAFRVAHAGLSQAFEGCEGISGDVQGQNATKTPAKPTKSRDLWHAACIFARAGSHCLCWADARLPRVQNTTQKTGIMHVRCVFHHSYDPRPTKQHLNHAFGSRLESQTGWWVRDLARRSAFKLAARRPCAGCTPNRHLRRKAQAFKKSLATSKWLPNPSTRPRNASLRKSR